MAAVFVVLSLTGCHHAPAVSGIAGAGSVSTAPRSPVAGQSTTLTIRGQARGGRFLIPREVTFGDGRHQYFAMPSCAPPSPTPPPLSVDPFHLRLTHTWPKAQTYTVVARLVSPCVPAVAPRTVTVGIHVS